MVKDPKSGDLLHAHHLIEQVLEKGFEGNKEALTQKEEEEEEKEDARRYRDSKAGRRCGGGIRRGSNEGV
jgi:hypothetical protein